ncbi:hypothetical protein GO684_00825 [Wolbachia endosymbiont of Litomosoides brasiliensis]|nr:hypothetical protein [Wolbachia endosymbiont of Litomosoides brasiliensis]
MLKISKLDEKVVELAKEILKKMQNNAYVTKKTNAVIVAKKYSITAVAKICYISEQTWIKHQENHNITIKEMRIRIQKRFGLNVSKSTAYCNVQK